MNLLSTIHNIIYSVSFDFITNKITFSMTNLNKKTVFDFTQQHSIYKMVGLSQTTYNLTHLAPLISLKACNVYPDDVIYIRTNIISNNSYDSYTHDLSDILQKIDIKCDMNEFIFLNDTITPVLSSCDTIKEISLKITDEDGEIINLDGQEFTCTLKVEETDNTNYLQQIKILLWETLNFKISKNK